MEMSMVSSGWPGMSSEARLWIYVADQPLTSVQQAALASHFDAFLSTWDAHGAPVRGGWALCLDRVFLLAAEPSPTPPTGCAIDRSVASLRTLGDTLGVDWFNRHHIMYRQSPTAPWEHAQIHAFWALRKAGRVTDTTEVLNTSAATMFEWLQSPAPRFADSWHARMW